MSEHTKALEKLSNDLNRDFPDDAHAVDNAIAQIAALREQNEALRKNQFDPMIQGSAAASEGARAVLEIVGEQMARQKEEIAVLREQNDSLNAQMQNRDAKIAALKAHLAAQNRA